MKFFTEKSNGTLTAMSPEGKILFMAVVRPSKVKNKDGQATGDSEYSIRVEFDPTNKEHVAFTNELAKLSPNKVETKANIKEGRLVINFKAPATKDQASGLRSVPVMNSKGQDARDDGDINTLYDTGTAKVLISAVPLKNPKEGTTHSIYLNGVVVTSTTRGDRPDYTEENRKAMLQALQG